MKKSILFLAAAGLMIAAPSCKKGENDPALSLSSRKARISGTWELSDWASNYKSTDSDGDYWETTSTYSGGTLTQNNTNYDAGAGVSTTSTTTYTINKYEIIVNKDGTWSSEFDYTAVETDSYTDFWGEDHTVTTTSVSNEKATGDWSFVGKVKGEYKNKERLVMNTMTSESTSTDTEVDENTTAGSSTTTTSSSSNSDTYTSGEIYDLWEIDQLKGKEMIWVMTEMSSGTSSFTSGGTTTTFTNPTDEGMTTITWAAVK